MRYALPLLLATLCACERERPQAAAERPAAPPVEKPADARPAIVAFGDSLTAGFGVDLGKSYPDFLQQELDRRGYRYRVVNQGVSGDTTTDGLARIGMVLAEKPEVVILEFGANDGLRGQPVAVVRSNLDQMLAALQRAGLRVVLAGMTLPPNYGPDYVRQFTAIYPELARKYKVALVP